MNRIILVITLFLFGSCVGNNTTRERDGANEIEEARLFTVSQHEGYRVIEVTNPWDTTKLLQRYILVNHSDSLPQSLPQGTVVRTPVSKVVVYTAIDVGAMLALGCEGDIVGVCDAKYIISPYIKERVSSGIIKDLGSYEKPNSEVLVSLNPDLIVTCPYNGKDYGIVEKLSIPLAECVNYMEYTPLARAEWIKFYAHFMNKQSVADSIYNDIVQRYKSTVDMISKKQTSRPKLLPEKRYGQVWYVASGDSYAAHLFNDAGANYLWSDVKSDGASIPLSFEKLFQTAHDADVWLFGYYKEHGDITLEELKAEYASYAEFEAYKKGNVYACNTGRKTFYEESPLRPDLMLLDVAKMLHPQLFENHEFVFYKKVE